MTNVEELQARDYERIDDPTGFDPASLAEESADRHYAALGPSLSLRARCSVWWRDTASLDGRRIGTIGHYAATDPEAGRAVIRQALAKLRSRGCAIAVGPMNGNTWRTYRFVVERGTAKPFFLEPDNPDGWPDHFGDCGFEPLSWYVSEINPDIANRQPALGCLRHKMDRLGVTIRALNSDDPDDDMNGIYDVVCSSFRDSFLYTPVDRDSYTSLYEPLLTRVDPRLVLVAEHDDRVVGFIFSPPDYLQQTAGDKIDTIVIKTVAILPRKRYSGLGRLLIVELLHKALELGYSKAISALMQAENRSQKISCDCAGPMRRYALFARSLSA
ncbi:MAG: GNAT family N-acetyltransferase [Woeseiaceae bacterium]